MGEAKRRRAASKPEVKPSFLITVSLAPLVDGYMSMYFKPGIEKESLAQASVRLVAIAEKIICHRLDIPVVLATVLSEGDDKLLAILKRILRPEHWADVEMMHTQPPCFTCVFGHGPDEELLALH